MRRRIKLFPLAKGAFRFVTNQPRVDTGFVKFLNNTVYDLIYRELIQFYIRNKQHIKFPFFDEKF